jgi:hypothetical protein
MSNSIYTGGEKRQLAFKKLESFISNQGMFSLVVLGSRGTGKKFVIQKLFEKFKKEKTKKDLEKLRLLDVTFLSPLNFPDDIDRLFEENINKTIVFEDYENLSEKQKTILLDALSTTDGSFGLKEKVKVRIIFTSSQKIENLKTDTISNLFWDRISQLLVEFPSFEDEASHILKDFEVTWDKMEFWKINKDLAKPPTLDRLKSFLQKQSSDFVGGFRDLDKIACLYFNYRLFYYGEEKRIKPDIEDKVFIDVKNDFIGKTQMPTAEKTFTSIFDFDDVKPSDDEKQYPTLDDYNSYFRIQFRKYLLDKHKTLSKAAQNINCSIHTLKGYKDKSQK